MGGVAVGLMAFFAYLIVRASAPQMSPLFTDLSVEDSSAIIKDLERQGIPFDIKNEGTMVLVAREQIPRLRMKLAEGGLPKGGGVGYEIFDKSDASAPRASCRTSITCACWKASCPAPSAPSTACSRRACISCCRN